MAVVAKKRRQHSKLEENLPERGVSQPSAVQHTRRAQVS
jgi:hypothetical protein